MADFDQFNLPEKANEYITKDEAIGLMFNLMANFRGVIKANSSFSNIAVNLTNMSSYIAGESLNASSTPQSVYKDTSDGKVYLTDADDSSLGHRRFFGLVKKGQSVVAGQNVEIITEGIVDGFASLTNGSYIYMDTTPGALTQTAPSNVIRIGIAIGTDKVLVFPNTLKLASGTVTKGCNGSDSTTTVTLGFRPRTVWVFSVLTGNDSGSCNGDATICSGAWSDSSGRAACCMNAVGLTSSNSSNLGQSLGGAEGEARVDVDTITENGFNLVITVIDTGAGGVGNIAKADVAWVAIGE